MGKKRQGKVVAAERPCNKWLPKNDYHASSRSKTNMDLSTMLNLQSSRSRDPLIGMEYLSQPVEVTSTRQTKLNSFFKKTSVTVPVGRVRNSPSDLLEDSSDADLPLGHVSPSEVGPELSQNCDSLPNNTSADGTRCRNEQSKGTGFTLRLPENIPCDDMMEQRKESVELSPSLLTRGKRKRKGEPVSGFSPDGTYRHSGSGSDDQSRTDNSLLELDPNIFGSPEYDATFLKQTSRLKRENAPNAEHILHKHDKMHTERIDPRSNSGDSSVQKRFLVEKSKHTCKEHSKPKAPGSAHSDFSVDSSQSFTQRLDRKRETFKQVITNFEKDLEEVTGLAHKRPRKRSTEVSPDSQLLTFHMADSQQGTEGEGSGVSSCDTRYTFHEKTQDGKSAKDGRTQDSSPENYTFHIKPKTKGTSKYDKFESYSQGEEYTFHVRPDPILLSDEEYTFHAKPGQVEADSNSDDTQFSQNDDDFSPLTFH